MESVLVTVRNGLLEGGARLDLTHQYPYSESEAWEAFYRAARKHGWSTLGMGPRQFPQ
jgi:hypothetical protein